MKFKIILILSIFFCITGINKSYAVNLEAGDWNFGINGFLDGEVTYMGRLPICMGCTNKLTEAAAERFFFNQHHLNLLFGAEKGKARVNINFKSHSAYSSEDGGRGAFEIEEAYGVYSFHDMFKFQVGYMESPFGIYNDVRYITPLFATVVLPQMYLMPPNYSTGTSLIQSNFMPPHANLMIMGTYSEEFVEIDYSVYFSNGEWLVSDNESLTGIDEDRDKGVGVRLKLILMENYKVGFSYFTVDNDNDNFENDRTVGREHLVGFDVEIDLFELLKMEAEFVQDYFDMRSDRYAYYVRLTGYLGNFSPFLAYDFAKDKANSLYKRGQARYGVGIGYKLSDTVTLKAEYHLHKFNEWSTPPALTRGTHTINMIRSSMIFVF